ncbi:MAG: hypothetical protein JWO22_4241 [Frankiales bacterium]|nr:hypothetical protein [Frankiales bacterium]
MSAHEWSVIAEFDAGYVLGQCRTCGMQDLLDVGALLPAPRRAATPSTEATPADAALALS